ncbi:MAG: cysteine desulfurase [Actinobacteria bacterium]|nr:cysteine desulfurase [Actinomycetota bacterium]
MPDAYLDHAATTPLRPEAIAAMEPVLAGSLGNPSGAHRLAREARRLLDDARDAVADAVGARSGEVIFTSGGTEADNLAIAGITQATGRRPLCSGAEHHAVLGPVRAAGGSTVATDHHGRIDLAALERELGAGPPIGLVSAMLANNEVGTGQSVAGVAELVRRCSPDTFVHTDAVAAAPWIDLASHTAAAHLVTLSAHKVGGPPGIGALVVRDGTPLAPLLRGGGQERERRAGTPNLVGAVGFAAALAATVRDRAATAARVEALRARLVAGIGEQVSDAVVLGPPEPDRRMPGTVLACFAGVDREELVLLLDRAGVAASWGSSCSSGASEPSHVLAAMGVAPELAAGALRLSLGWCSTDADVDAVLAVLPDAVARARGATAPAEVSAR